MASDRGPSHDSLRLPVDRDCEAVFRQYVRLACHQRRRDALLDRVLLVTDELVSNSIRHAGGPERFVEVAILPTQRGVRVEVSDGDPTPPAPRDATADDLSGRGLQVVTSIADEWGCDSSEQGKTVWAEINPR